MTRENRLLRAATNTYLAGVGLLSIPDNPWLYPIWLLVVCLVGIVTLVHVNRTPEENP